MSNQLPIENRSYFPQLNSLRGIFMIFIVFYHIPIYPYWESDLLIVKLYNYIIGFLSNYGGQLGNSFFFILSGFLCCHSTVKKHLIGKNESFFEYYLNKFIRIYPSYLTANCFSLIIARIISGSGSVTAFDVLKNINLFYYGWIGNDFFFNGPSWFVSVLMLCYLIYYFTVNLLLSSENRLGAICCTAIFIILGVFLYKRTYDIPIINFNVGLGLYTFNTGVLLYLALDSVVTPNQALLIELLSVVTLLIMITLLACNISFIETNKKLFISFSICPIVIILAVFNKTIYKLLMTNILVYLGKTSMITYFYHVPLYYLFKIIFEDYIETNLGHNYSMIIYLIFLLVCTSIIYQLKIKFDGKFLHL